MRTIGTQVRGIRCPIFRPGDDLAERVIDALLTSCKQANYQLNDRDVLGITESAVARTQGNFITADQIAKDVRSKFPSGEIGVTFPILSRNRFAVILQAIARGVDKVHLLFSYPADEVGNHLMDPEVVPGVLLTNRKLPRTGYALPDVTATLLAHYGVPLPDGMEGKDVFAP